MLWDTALYAAVFIIAYYIYTMIVQPYRIIRFYKKQGKVVAMTGKFNILGGDLPLQTEYAMKGKYPYDCVEDIMKANPESKVVLFMNGPVAKLYIHDLEFAEDMVALYSTNKVGRGFTTLYSNIFYWMGNSLINLE